MNTPRQCSIHICIVFVMQMVAKGKDVSHLFPSVVKNVVSKNQEVGVPVCGLYLYMYMFVLCVYMHMGVWECICVWECILVYIVQG